MLFLFCIAMHAFFECQGTGKHTLRLVTQAQQDLLRLLVFEAVMHITSTHAPPPWWFWSRWMSWWFCMESVTIQCVLMF